MVSKNLHIFAYTEENCTLESTMASKFCFAQASRCDCKSSCSLRRKENSTRGCPCKGNNIECSEEYKCGTRKNPCKNRVNMLMNQFRLDEKFDEFVCDTLQAVAENSERERDNRGKRTPAKQVKGRGFRLSHDLVEIEEAQREKEHKDVKV